MSVKIAGGASTAGNANVDSTFSLQTTLRDSKGNKSGLAQRERIVSNQEGIPMMVKNDDIAIFARGDRKGNLLTGNYNPEFIENFEGAIGNVQKWIFTPVTFVQAQSTLVGLTFNSSSIVTGGASSIAQTQRLFYKFPRVPLQFKARVRANVPTFSTVDIGFGAPTSTTLINPNGVSVRIINGLWTAVMTYNNAEIAVVNIVGIDGTTQLSTSSTNSEYFVVDGIIDDDNFVVTVQDTNSGLIVGRANLPVPLSAAKMFGATALPFYGRLFNAGTAPATAPIFVITECQVLSLDINLGMDASQVAGNLGLSGDRHPFSGIQNANFTNSTAPVSATLSNTAGGYATTIKDGKWQFAAIAGAVTDYALFSWVVPAGSKFIVEGVRIESRNTGATVAGTATTLEWGIVVNGIATSLASANLLRTTLGHQSFPIGALAEATATTIDTNFLTPMVCESGRVITLVLQMPVGTATALQVIRGIYNLKGRFI